MVVDFLLLTVVTFSFIFYILVVKKDYNKITFLYSFSLITIFYTPSFYFYFGGDVYRFFSDESLIDFFHISTLTICIYLILSILIGLIKIKQNILFVQNTILVRLYFLLFALPILLYYFVYFEYFPLVQLLLSGDLIERPDMTGSIPHFYTVSTVVSIIIPSIYFFYFKNIHNYLHIFINIILIFLFIASGNKGFLVYYFIFIWLYVMNRQINIKLVFMLIFLMLIYAVTKGILEYNEDVLSYMLNSPFRRFFVSQGTGFIHRVDMINEGFDFINNSNIRGLKFDVFSHMYNTSTIVGSAPTFYTGDLFAKYGIQFSLMVFVIISSILLYTSNYLYNLDTNIKLFLYWNIYAILFFIVMAEINLANMMRFLVGILNIYIVILLSRVRVKHV